MSSETTSYLRFGFPVSNSKLEKSGLKESDLESSNIEVIFAGNAFSGNGSLFVSVKNVGSCVCDSGISKFENLSISKEIQAEILNLANKLKVKALEISWYLVVSII